MRLSTCPGDDNTVAVTYDTKTEVFRALGRLLGAVGEDAWVFTETRRFDRIGVMIDVSRNAVLLLQTVKILLVHLALMGVNRVILYAEDTYEVEGEPFFGYFRGRYSQEEMRQLDEWADALGVEMFACIQTLGHLEQLLQWPQFGQYR